MSKIRSFTFVSVLSKTCSHCKNFKDTSLTTLKNRVKLIPGINRKEYIEVSNLASAFDESKYHPDFSRFITWFPTFIIFTTESWEAHDKELIGKVMGGNITDNKMTLSNKAEFSANPVDITNWIKKCMIDYPSGFQSFRNNKMKGLVSKGMLGGKQVIITEGTKNSLETLTTTRPQNKIRAIRLGEF